jgi:ABC-2 type transport system permease protein
MGGTLSDVLTEYRILWCQVVVYFIVACLVYRHQVNLARRHAEDYE